MDKTALVTLLQKEVRGLNSVLVVDDYRNAIDDAVRETGVSLPTTDDESIRWIKERTKRHLFFYLMTESAHKFKVKQYSLNQRFEHYKEIIDKMDEKWETFLETNILLGDDEPMGLFGTKVDAGFQYSETGVDTTYTDDNVVLHEPTDESA